MNFALIGYLLSHSMSFIIHERLFALGKKTGSYTIIETETISREHNIFKDCDGFNVTIPHKQAIIPFLDELDDTAKKIGAVNTVKRHNGVFIGYNTDCTGFLHALDAANIVLSGKVLITGCGGTSRMMCHLAAERGCDITVSCRPSGKEKAETLKNEIKNIYGTEPKITGQDNITEKFDLLLNGTPAGMYPNNMEITPVPEKTIINCKAVFDAVYNPKETLLLKTARENEAKTAYGMPMLVWQAAAAHKIWYEAEFDKKDINMLIQETNRYLNCKW